MAFIGGVFRFRGDREPSDFVFSMMTTTPTYYILFELSRLSSARPSPGRPPFIPADSLVVVNVARSSGVHIVHQTFTGQTNSLDGSGSEGAEVGNERRVF